MPLRIKFLLLLRLRLGILGSGLYLELSFGLAVAYPELVSGGGGGFQKSQI